MFLYGMHVCSKLCVSRIRFGQHFFFYIRLGIVGLELLSFLSPVRLGTMSMGISPGHTGVAVAPFATPITTATTKPTAAAAAAPVRARVRPSALAMRNGSNVVRRLLGAFESAEASAGLSDVVKKMSLDD